MTLLLLWYILRKGYDSMDELNFVLEFKLSKEGMINEIKNECDIIRIAISELNALGMEYSSVTNRIMIMPIIKFYLFLCDFYFTKSSPG